MFSSNTLADYLCTRFPAGEFIPLAAFVTAAGVAQSAPVQFSTLGIAMALALTLILQFRTWDDIADRNHDHFYHPERVISSIWNIKLFVGLAGILFMFNSMMLLWIHNFSLKPVVYLALCACLLAWYRFRPVALTPSLLNSHLVLLKYPVIAWLIGGPVTAANEFILLFCLLSVYLIFLIFEVLDDQELHRLPGARISLIANVPLLGCVWVLIAVWNRPDINTTFGAIWALIAFSTLALGYSGLSTLGKESETRRGRGFFVVGLLAYIALAVEESL